jgi:membrane associated rhomboid family serine protease
MGIYDRPYYSDATSPDLSPSWDKRSAVSLIVIACAVVFLANMVFTGRDNGLSLALSLSSDDAWQPWMWWRTLSYGFVHSPSRIGHILFNMFELWMLGRSVEEHYGRAEFGRIYLVAVVFCGAGWLLLRWLMGDAALLSGASGAVCCITMLYILNFPRATLLLFGVIPIQAWMLGLFLILTNIFSQTPSLGSLPGRDAPRVAFDVHLLGIALAFAYFYGRWNFSALVSPWDRLRALRRRWFGPRLRTYRPTQDPQVIDETEADRILDKIHRLGQDSLTKRERQLLTEYSKQVRQKRENSQF